MWVDHLEPGQSWSGIWLKLITCGFCHALIDPNHPCPKCGHDYSKSNSENNDYGENTNVVFAGAISWTTYTLLSLMQREWNRPTIEDTFGGVPYDKKPSQRVLIVLLFWSLFEDLMNRFFNNGMRSLPAKVKDDLLKRHSSIGSRLDRLYKIIFPSSFKDDLTNLGYGDIYRLLIQIQKRRNEFVHGNPEAINETIVIETVSQLQRIQEAWIDLYNLRCTEVPNTRDL
jgi:hypothetical protein